MKANDTSEWMWQVYFKFVLGGFIACTATSTIATVLICLKIHGKIDTNYLYYTYKVV